MPGIRENVAKTINQNAEQSAATTSKPLKEKAAKTRTMEPTPKSSGEYSPRSPIAKAYRAGQMPVDHRRLLDAIKGLLGEGVKEGNIQLEEALKTTGYFRASALKMLRHMQNFGILETRRGYRETWVKILKD